MPRKRPSSFTQMTAKPAFSVAARERHGLSKQHKQPIPALGEQTTKVSIPAEIKPKQLMAKQPGTQLNSNAISPCLQINFPTPLSGVNVPLGGRLRLFHKNWNMITSDPYILEIVQCYKLDLVEVPFQAFTPKPLLFSKSFSTMKFAICTPKTPFEWRNPPTDSLSVPCLPCQKRTAEQGL